MNKEINALAITSPPQLQSERLIFRPVSAELRPFVFLGLSDGKVRTRMKMPVLDTDEKQQQWWDRFNTWRQNGEAVQWCAFFRDTGDYAGLFTLKEIDQKHHRGELGYSVMEQYWGQGLGAEGAKTLVKYAFEQIGLHSLFAQILPYNTASQRIVKRLGFVPEGEFRDMHFYEGSFYNVLQFGLINPDH